VVEAGCFVRMALISHCDRSNGHMSRNDREIFGLFKNVHIICNEYINEKLLKRNPRSLSNFECSNG